MSLGNIAWATHPDFSQFIKDNWNKEGDIEGNKKELASKLQEWNKNTFGNIFQRKKRVLARLDGVQRSMSNQPRADLIRLNKNLQNELQEILLQEELLWFQRSREDWITSGD